MEPLVTALLLQAAEIDADDVVLDVGCGTGYCSAIIAGMASTVVALESDADLAARAAAEPFTFARQVSELERIYKRLGRRNR